MACHLCDFATVGCMHCSVAMRQQSQPYILAAGSSAQLGLTAQQTYAVASAAQAQSYSNLLKPAPLTADSLKQAILEGVAGATRPRLSLEDLEQEIAKVKAQLQKPEAAAKAKAQLPVRVICLGEWWRVEGYDYPVYVVGFDSSGKNIMANDLEHPGETSVISRHRFVELVGEPAAAKERRKRKKKPTPPSHEWTIERGNLVFCGWCGEETSERESDACEPMSEETVKERIESTIAVAMYNHGHFGRWQNQPMAIEARAKHAATRRVAYWKVSRTREQDLIGGWNKRAP